MDHYDTIIVGAGPAGTAAARELVEAGHSCAILDRKPFPRVKLCGGWITEKVLQDLRIEPEAYPHGMVQLDQFRFILGRRHRISRVVSARQFSIRRVEFDHWLWQRSGAPLVNHTVREITRQNGYYQIDDQFQCRHLIGAGGTNCPVRKHLFPDDGGRLIVAQEVEFETRPHSPICTLWFPFAGPFGYAWYVPKANAVNVGFGGLRSQNTHWDKAALWSSFIDLLRRAECISEPPPPPKGYSYYIGNRQKRVRNDRAWIVGDAAGLATADLAEGIGPAIESGQLAAREILGTGRYAVSQITRFSLAWRHRCLRYSFAWLP